MMKNVHEKKIRQREVEKESQKDAMDTKIACKKKKKKKKNQQKEVKTEGMQTLPPAPMAMIRQCGSQGRFIWSVVPVGGPP